MMLFAVGEKHPVLTTWDQNVSGVVYDYDCSGHWQHYFLKKPTKKEIDSIQSGPARFGLFTHDNIIFLLSQFGDMDWNDAGYSCFLVQEDRKQLPDITEKGHGLLTTVLVDTETMIVEAMRTLTFSVEFTDRIHHEIIRQSKQKPWDSSENNQRIAAIYSKFTTPQMVKQSQIFCNGGD